MKRNLSRVGYQEQEDPADWRKEIQRETSTLRFCLTCSDFQQFSFKSKTPKLMYLQCSNCGEKVKIIRKK